MKGADRYFDMLCPHCGQTITEYDLRMIELHVRPVTSAMIQCLNSKCKVQLVKVTVAKKLGVDPVPIIIELWNTRAPA